MTVLGSSQIALITKIGTVFSKALVTSNLAHPVLLSWHDLIRLRVIINTFPRPSAFSAETSSRLDILRQLPKVFRDELTLTPMKSEKVHLHLKLNATPFRVLAARQIPLQFRGAAVATIKELLTKQVITPCHEPMGWCSPAFFVVKPDGKNIRMVTDFTRLNSFVERPVHPFACMSEIK